MTRGMVDVDWSRKPTKSELAFLLLFTWSNVGRGKGKIDGEIIERRLAREEIVTEQKREDVPHS